MSGKTHELKVWPEFFKVLLTGKKTFELRKDDRGYHAGDLLRLREWQVLAFNAPNGRYTGREITRVVTYLLGGWGLEKDYVCMSLGLPEPPPADPFDSEKQQDTRPAIERAAYPDQALAREAGVSEPMGEGNNE